MRFLATFALAAATLGWGVPASACSIAFVAMTPAQVRDYARDQFAHAVAVVDAEVDVPMNLQAQGGALPMAVLRVIGQYKGAEISGGMLPLVYFSSCDIALTRKGERVRLLLTDGPNLFRATQFAHAPNTFRDGAQSEFNAEIDQLVGAPRAAGFSAYPGAIALPQ